MLLLLDENSNKSLFARSKMVPPAIHANNGRIYACRTYFFLSRNATTTSFVGMGNVVTRDSFEWLFSDPKMVKASEVVGRLMNDIVSHKVL